MLEFEYDRALDVLTVEGVRYSGDLFRELARGIGLYKPFQIIERNDGVIVIESIHNSIEGD